MSDSHIIAENGENHKTQIPPPHFSTLSGCLYFLSFAPPFPSIHKPIQFATHPYSLYVVGIASGMLAGCAFPFGNYIQGIAFGNLNHNHTSVEIMSNARKYVWLFALTCPVTIIFLSLMGICCECKEECTLQPESNTG
jgi:hypothetical protein